MRVAGFGFRKGARSESLIDAFQRALAQGGLSQVDAVATEKSKAESTVFKDLSDVLNVVSLSVPAEDIAATPTRTQSPRVAARFGTGSLAEAAALCGAGPGARLVAARAVSGDGMATAAIAQTERTTT